VEVAARRALAGLKTGRYMGETGPDGKMGTPVLRTGCAGFWEAPILAGMGREKCGRSKAKGPGTPLGGERSRRDVHL